MLSARRCETCRWWAQEPPIATAARLPGGSAEDVGSCHVAGPPEIFRINDGWVSLFPAVRAHRFCAEWQADDDGDDPDDGEREAADNIIELRSAA